MENEWYGCCAPLATICIKTVEQGAQTTIYCAVEDSIENHSGRQEGKGLILNTSQSYHPSWTHDNHDHRFYYDCTEKAPSAAAMSEADAKRLWEVSEKLVGLDKREDGWTGQNKDEVAED